MEAWHSSIATGPAPPLAWVSALGSARPLAPARGGLGAPRAAPDAALRAQAERRPVTLGDFVGGAAAVGSALCARAARRRRLADRGRSDGGGRRKAKAKVSPEVLQRREERRREREQHMLERGEEPLRGPPRVLDTGRDDSKDGPVGFGDRPEVWERGSDPVGTDTDDRSPEERKQARELRRGEPSWLNQIERAQQRRGDQEELDPEATKKEKHKAPWKEAEDEARKDISYTTEWVWNRESGWKKGEARSRLEELNQEASELRSLFHRPQSNWNDVRKNDARVQRLTTDLPVIGDEKVWLSKFLSHSGACSRRDVTDLVMQGRVQINGTVVKNVAMKVDPNEDIVTIDGKEQSIRTLGEIIWIMLYKPRGVLSTMDDPQGRGTVMDLVPFSRQRRLCPVGRLERNSSGIIMLTNDYEWMNVLTHPRYERRKYYKVEIYNGIPNHEKMRALRMGLQLPDQKWALNPIEDIETSWKDRDNEIAVLRFSLTQGVYRQIRRMFEFIGHPVKSVKRMAMGLVKLDRDLRPGDWRQLTPREIRRLKGETLLKTSTPPKHILDQQAFAAKSSTDQAGRPQQLDEQMDQRTSKALARERHLEEMAALREGRLPADMLNSGGQASKTEDVLDEVPKLKKKKRRSASREDVGNSSGDDTVSQKRKRRERKQEPERASTQDLRRLQAAFVTAGESSSDPDYSFAFEQLEADPAAASRLEHASSDIDDLGSDWEQDWVAQLDAGQLPERQDDKGSFTLVPEEAAVPGGGDEWGKGLAQQQAPIPGGDDEWDKSWAQQLDAVQAERSEGPGATVKKQRRKEKKVQRGLKGGKNTKMDSERKAKLKSFLASVKAPSEPLQA